MKVCSTPILRGPNWSLPFHISIDSLDFAIGVLGQKDGSLNYEIYFTSKNMIPTEMNYIASEEEFLSVIHAINKFRNYIRSYEVYLHTNHFDIKYLMNKPITTSRVTRWFLLLQEFHVTILERPSSQNMVAYFFIKDQE